MTFWTYFSAFVLGETVAAGFGFVTGACFDGAVLPLAHAQIQASRLTVATV